MKKLSFLIVLLATFGCSQSDKNIEINLHDSEGFGVFNESRVILWPKRFELAYTGVPENIEEYVIRSISMQPEQEYWELYQKGHLSGEQFENLITRFEIDTMLLAGRAFNHRVLILIGTNQNGRRVIIPDANNDQDFSNDKVFEYDYPLEIEEQLEAEKSLPSVEVNVQLFVNNEIIDHKVGLVLSPYETRNRLTYNVENETEKNYHLFASIPMHKQGLLRLNDKTYKVHVTNETAGVLFNERNTQIFIVPDTIVPSKRSGDIPSAPGDIISLDGSDYKIAGITPLGETIRLEYLGENQRPVGITEEYFVPKFNAITLERDVFRLDDFPDKYILLDFWGTWCNPCIRLIPELKKLNAEFKNTNFQLVGIAYDRDIDMVSNFVEENEMDWVHLFVDQNQRERGSVVDVFKVTTFPTKILIDPSGKIIARGRNIEELRAVLKEKIITL